MKFFNQSNDKRQVTASNRKPQQQLLTLLEPRRMMSVTGGVDYLPTPDAAPTQFTHSFGFEHTLNAGGLNAGDAARPMMQFNSDFGQPTPDFNSFDAQFARALAQATAVDDSDSNVSDVPDHGVHVNTLTSMYSQLSTSTAIAIDNATATSTGQTLKAVGDTTFHATLGDGTGVVAATTITMPAVVNQDLTVALPAAATSTLAAATTVQPIETTIAPAVSLPASALLVTTSTAQIAQPRISMQALEQEMLTVSTLASEMISQLGRDIAIEISHFESDMSFDSISQQLSSHMDGWRSAAAVAGAAIATIVYVQSEADHEKPKANTTFSTKLIEAIPS